MFQGFKELYDPILAYSFIYPTVTSEGQQLQMTLTHPPEKVRAAVRACGGRPGCWGATPGNGLGLGGA